MADIFVFLEKIHARPTAFLSGSGTPLDWLREIASMTFGYSTALRQHEIREPVLAFEVEFNQFLARTKGWSTSTGPVEAIRRSTATDLEAWELFWKLVEDFKAHTLRHGAATSTRSSKRDGKT